MEKIADGAPGRFLTNPRPIRPAARGYPTAPSNVYDVLALHRVHDITLIVLACVAAAAWLLYLYLVLFRSGKTRTNWLKRRLGDLLVVVSIALIGFLVSFLLSLLHSRR